MSENIPQSQTVSKGLSIMIVILISLLISFIISFLGYFYIFPKIEKEHFTVKVPDVRFLTISEADTRLKSVGLNYNVVEEQESETVPTGKIISQFPLPKTKVKKGEEISIIVSKGIPMVVVPEIKLKLLQEAQKLIHNAGLVVGNVTEVETDEFPVGVVIDSNPKEKQQVNKGSVVDLTISKPKPRPQPKKIVVRKVTVPNIIGKSLVEAKKILESRGLILGEVKNVTDEDKEFDIILSQTPSSGATVPQGSKVNVTYNTESQE